MSYYPGGDLPDTPGVRLGRSGEPNAPALPIAAPATLEATPTACGWLDVRSGHPRHNQRPHPSQQAS